MKKFLTLWLLALTAFAGRAQQFEPVAPNPFGERPVLAPVPATVAGVAEPVLTIPATDFKRVDGSPVRFEAQVRIPESFAGKRTVVRFNGSGTNTTLLVGGREIRHHWAHSYAWGADITDYVQAGVPVTLALRCEPSEGGLNGRAFGPAAGKGNICREGGS